MAELSKITLPNGTIVSLKDAKKSGVYTVIGTQTQATGAWTGDIDVNSLYAGLTIAYFLPYSGSGSASLNLTLSDGTTTGAKACYYNNTAITTQFPAGATIIMTYWPAGSITVEGTATTDDRWITTSIVTGVKGDAESSYRTGNVNITKANIGLGNVDNTADADKNVKTAKYRMPMVLGSNFDLNALSDQSTYPSEVYNGVSALNCNFPIEVAGHAFVIDVSRTAFTSGSDEYMRMLAYDVTAQKYYIRSYSLTSETWSDWHDITLDLNVQSIATDTDLNTLTETGNYFSYAHGGNKNFPSTLTANHMALISVLSYDYNGDYISQTVTDLRTGDTYVRGRTANFGWTSWMPSTLSGTSPISVSGKGVVSHDDSGATAGSYGDSSAQTPAYGATFKVPYVTVDAKGHVTGISDHTVKIPASDNTTYTFANGTNSFTVTPSGGTAQTVTVTPSIADATTSASGLMSASDKSKLNGIATGAEVNQNAFSNVKVGSTTIAADSKTDTLTLVAGSNVTLTPDATNDKVTIEATDTTYNVATLSEDGLMSTSDRAFLDDLSYPAYLNGAVVPKGQESPVERVTNYAVCSTAAATTAKTVNTGWDFDLYTGSIVFIKFTVTNSGAVASLTLNVNDTGAKPIKYRAANLSSAGTLAANRVYGFVYDGANWELMGDLDTNSNTYDRTSINTTFKAATATSASFLLCGTDAGYKNVAKGTAFDISYPLLYCGTAIAAGGTRSDGYIQIPMNCTTTNGGTSPAFTAYKMVFLKGKLTAGKTFTIDSSTLFTQAVPTTADGFQYYCVGLAGSATNIFLTPHHDVYEYLGGSFHKVSVYAEDSAKVNGLTVQTAVPANALFTDTVTTVTTSGSGNAVTALSASNGAITATKGSTFLTSHQTIKQDGVTGATVNRFGTCSSATSANAKTVSITTGTFSLEVGAKVTVKFTNANTAEAPLTLNVNSTGAKNIYFRGAALARPNTTLLTGVCDFVYDGTNWNLIGNYIDTDTNTWRNITVNGTAWKGTGTGTGVENLVQGSGIALTTSGNDLTISTDPTTATVTLTASGWLNNSQTVTVSGVTASNHVIISPATASYSDYVAAGIICTAQASNSLTFTCSTVPTAVITVNVMILG